MSQLIPLLAQGQSPDRKVEVAKFKPPADVEPLRVREEFRAFTASAISAIDSRIADRNGGATLFHPWFGPMSAHQWHWLLGAHTAIHYRQVREIARGLK